MSKSTNRLGAATLIAAILALGFLNRPVLTQTANLLFASFSNAPKVLTATTNGYLNVIVGGGSIAGIDSICLNATNKDACLAESANALLVKIQEPVPAQPTVALAGAGAGNVTNGTHVCAVTKITASGQTDASASSTSVNVVDHTVNGQVTVTFSLGTLGIVTGRNIYCSKANTATPLFLVATAPTVANNTATTYTLNIADASFTATGVPASNTTMDTRLSVNATNTTTSNIFTMSYQGGGAFVLNNSLADGGVIGQSYMTIQTAGVARWYLGMSAAANTGNFDLYDGIDGYNTISVLKGSGVVLAVKGLGLGASTICSPTAPARASGFGTNADASFATGSSTCAFDMNIGTGGAPTSGVLTMPAAAHGWTCQVHDVTTPADITTQSAYTQTSVTFVTTIAWVANDHLFANCIGF